MQVKLKFNNQIKKLKEKIQNFEQLLKQIKQHFQVERVKIEFQDNDKEYLVVRD